MLSKLDTQIDTVRCINEVDDNSSMTKWSNKSINKNRNLTTGLDKIFAKEMAYVALSQVYYPLKIMLIVVKVIKMNDKSSKISKSKV